MIPTRLLIKHCPNIFPVWRLINPWGFYNHNYTLVIFGRYTLAKYTEYVDVGPHVSGCFRPCCSATATSATDVDGCGMLWGNLAGIFPKKERIKTSQSSSKQHPRFAPLLRGILNFISQDGLMPNIMPCWGWLTSTQSWALTRVPSFGQPFFLYATPAGPARGQPFRGPCNPPRCPMGTKSWRPSLSSPVARAKRGIVTVA